MDCDSPQVHYGDQALPCIYVCRDAGVANKLAGSREFHNLDPTFKYKACVAAHLYIPICPHIYHCAHLCHTLSENYQFSGWGVMKLDV